MPPPTNRAVSPGAASSTGKPFPNGQRTSTSSPAFFVDNIFVPLPPAR